MTGVRAATAVAAMTMAACASGLNSQAGAGGERDALNRCVRAKAERDDFSGVVVAMHHGETVISVARGALAEPGGAPITPATRFNIASAGKMFTAVAVAQLVDAGKIEFGDPIGRHVAGLSPQTAAVTVHQLLTHTSGLGNFFAPQNLAALRNARTANDLLPLIASEVPDFPPGSRFRYSNSGFALLGVLIERVSGETYAEYLRRHVFLPAGMAKSGVDPEPVDTLAVAMTKATPGSRPGGALEGPLHRAPGGMLYGSPAGGAFTTALDLQKFAAALMGNRLTSAASTAALLTRKTLAGSEAAYGYGFGLRTAGGRDWVGHNGGTLGANAEFHLLPGEGWSVAVLSNRDPPSATAVFAYLEELIADPAKIAGCAG